MLCSVSMAALLALRSWITRAWKSFVACNQSQGSGQATA